MTTNARIGYGTTIGYRPLGSQANAAYTVIAEVQDISGPSLSLDTVDATHMTSPNGYRQFIAGLKDAGEVSFDVNFLPADTSQQGVTTALEGGTALEWRLDWPGTTVMWDFVGFVTGFEPASPLDDKMTASITIKLTGDPNLAGT